MNKMKYFWKSCLLVVVLMGAFSFSNQVQADKKANEGQNFADVEFYEPTPEKPKPKPVDPPKKEKPTGIKKLLPKTGETDNNNQMIFGIILVGAVMIIMSSRKRVGDANEI